MDIGCGTGGVLEVIAGALKGTRLVGYDLSAQAIGLVERSDKVDLRVGTPQDVHDHYDLLLSLDVFEHVEDYIGFLRSLRPIADWFMFHIPLDYRPNPSCVKDLCLQCALRLAIFITSRAAPRWLALRRRASTIVCDRLLFPNDVPGRRMKTRIANIPRGLGRHFRPQLSARILGGSTLLVLATATPDGRPSNSS